jgi:hypothetical protein
VVMSGVVRLSKEQRAVSGRVGVPLCVRVGMPVCACVCLCVSVCVCVHAGISGWLGFLFSDPEFVFFTTIF